MVKKILFIIFLGLSTAVFSQKTLQKLTVAPNPIHSSATIQFQSKNKQPIFLIVKNVLGKTVFKRTYTAKTGTNRIFFNRNNLQAGMYIYAIQTRKEIISKRFVIK